MWRDGPPAGWSRLARTERRLGLVERRLKRVPYPRLSRALEDAAVRAAIEGPLEETGTTVPQPTYLPVAALAGA